MLENLKLLEKDMKSKGMTICTFTFLYKSVNYIVLVKRFVSIVEKIDKYALVKLKFMKETNRDNSLTVEANIRGLIINPKKLRKYFGIKFSNNLGNTLQQFTERLGRYIPTEIKLKHSDYALKLKIKDIVSADKAQFEAWEQYLKYYVNKIMSKDNSDHARNSVSKSQESVWMNCFVFISKTLKSLSPAEQKFSLVFEYSLPGTVHERPDVLLLTNSKVISLEFKRKEAPQIDDNKDDVAQAIRYKEWLQNHHKVTKDKNLDVKSYLVCTHHNANPGEIRGITILNIDNFCSAIHNELIGENQCTFENEWYTSPKTEMPDMLQAIEIMYREGRIPYISGVNKTCLDKVLWYIE